MGLFSIIDIDGGNWFQLIFGTHATLLAGFNMGNLISKDEMKIISNLDSIGRITLNSLLRLLIIMFIKKISI